MNKQEFMKMYNIKLRELNTDDLMQATTDYQRNADYIITYANGSEAYSKKGTFKDIQENLKLAYNI